VTDGFTALYQIAFFSAVGLLLLLERVRSFQRQSVRIAGRWTANIGLLLIVSVIASVAIPAGVYGVAQAQAPGMIAQLGVPIPVQIGLTFLFLDLWRYWEHRVFHRTPLLWRAHLVHHSDTQIDVTTTERHHPFESILSTAVMIVLILACGLPATAVGLYLVVATVVSLWSHANLRLPDAADRLMRLILVTPRVHAVHHSDLKAETDSNYGTVFTLWDRAFGSYVDPDDARIPHFGLEYFHRERDTAIGRVLLQPLMYRVGMAYPRREDRPEAPVAPGLALTPAWKDVLLAGLAGCVLAAVVLWPTLFNLAALWANSEAYQYAWLVVPMTLYVLAWDRRRETFALNPQPGFTGVLLAAGAAALWSIAGLMNVDLGRHIALVLVVQGIAMAMLGWRSYWRLFPILALLFLAIPSGDVLQPFLRAATVRSLELFAGLAQLPHTVEGFVVHIGNHRYMVAEECSGLSYVTLAIFLSYSFGLLLYRSIFKIAALALFGALLGIFSNALRVNSIVLIDWFSGSQMELSSHAGIQWIALLTTLGALFVVLGRLQPDALPAAPVACQDRAVPVRRLAPVIAGLMVLVIVGGFHMLPVDEPRAPRMARASSPPNELLGWKLVSPSARWIVDPGNQTESLSLAYRRDGEDMHVLIVETLAPTAKLSRAQLTFDDKGMWREGQIRNESVCVDSRCLPVLHSTWQRSKSKDQRHVFYSYGIGDLSTDSTLSLRAVHGWHRLTGQDGTPRLIAFDFGGLAPAIDDVGAAFLAVRSALDAGRL
jgi:exosortase